MIIIRSKGDYNTYSSNSTNYIFHLDHNMISYPFKYPKNINSIELYSKNNTSCARGNISLSKSFWKQKEQRYYKVHFDYPFDNCSDINSLFYTKESFSLSRNINQKNSLLFLSKELGTIDHLTVYYDHQESKENKEKNGIVMNVKPIVIGDVHLIEYALMKTVKSTMRISTLCILSRLVWRMWPQMILLK